MSRNRIYTIGFIWTQNDVNTIHPYLSYAHVRTQWIFVSVYDRKQDEGFT